MPYLGDGQENLDADLGVIDGVVIVLCRVEIDAEVAVCIAARPNARTATRDAAHRAAFESWAAEALTFNSRCERPPNPPAQPGEILTAIALSITDDVGTSYRSRSRQAAGTGTEWDAIWRFGPVPPPAATRLWVAIDDLSGKRCAVPLTPPS